MSRSHCASVVLLVVALILPAFHVSAQDLSGDVPTATGDVWPPKPLSAYVPREALELPDPGPPGDLEIATGEVWPSRQDAPLSDRWVPAIPGEQVHGQMTR